jgi:hypothetical protein
VGFEPTTSRVSGEVTLSCTTSNLVASRHYFRRERTPWRRAKSSQPRVFFPCYGANRPPISDSRRQIRAGRNYRAELRSSSPASFADEVALLRAIPASSCGGNPRRGRFLSAALPLSCGGLRHRWESNPRPSARRSNPRLHHAANSCVSLFSLLRYLFASPPGTPAASRFEVRITPPSQEPLKIPGGIGAHGLSGFEPEPFGLATEVTVNFTIPGSSLFAKHFCHKKRFTLSL